ncbi:hypothetical protein J2847_000406 [Azospirillum agricola]|uniref:hypothetical protein n=1 Tax=Azospirillum agricola TaxID=1720247 RepID=UPI001AEB4C5E|nr:hypothetical protein [Azospirillum agricola]MBP2227139.1 hypothetical protein [Azospirillum agricola]
MKALGLLVIVAFSADQSLGSVSAIGVYLQAVGAYILFAESNNDHLLLIEHFRNLTDRRNLTPTERWAFLGLLVFVLAVAVVSSMTYRAPASDTGVKIWVLRGVAIFSVVMCYAIYFYSYKKLKGFMYDVQVRIDRNQTEILESGGVIDGSRTRAEFRRVGFAFILCGACFQIFSSVIVSFSKPVLLFVECIVNLIASVIP